jgi:hypothetical protein
MLSLHKLNWIQFYHMQILLQLYTNFINISLWKINPKHINDCRNPVKSPYTALNNKSFIDMIVP